MNNENKDFTELYTFLDERIEVLKNIASKDNTRWYTKVIDSIARIELEHDDKDDRLEAYQDYIIGLSRQLDNKEKREYNLMNNIK